MTVVAEAIEEAGESFKPFGNAGPLVRAASDATVRERYYGRIAEQAEAGDSPEKLAERRKKAFARSVKSLVDAKLLVAAKHKGERFLWLS